MSEALLQTVATVSHQVARTRVVTRERGRSNTRGRDARRTHAAPEGKPEIRRGIRQA